MKRFFIVLVVIVILAPLSASSAVVGDVDGDGKIELSEAIYALQVASGYYLGVNNSCQLVGKSDWRASTTYVECDVVKEGGSFYICTIGHPSSADFSSDSANWTMLALPAAWDKNGSDIYYNSGKVGIGTISPNANLDILGSQSTLLDIQNSTQLGTDVETEIGFKNGTWWTGLIKTIGRSTAAARMGFFTFANLDRSSLKERVSITDSGLVGIGTTSPGAMLEVNGQVKITGGSPGAGKVLTTDAAGLARWEAQTQIDRKYIFVTTSTYTGDLGGLYGADNICNSEAAAAGLPGTYLAWLSSNVTGWLASPAVRFNKSSNDYVTPNGIDGILVAHGWVNLTDGYLDYEINRYANGQYADGTNVWTNTTVKGEMYTESYTATCSNWESSDANYTGMAGVSSTTGQAWTNTQVEFECDSQYRLYCVQQ